MPAQVAFRANLTGSGVGSTNKVGVWSEGSGNLGLVARTGSGAPGGGTFGTVTNAELFSPNLNNAGQTAFYGALTNGDMGIWSEGSGSLALVAREGTPAPGTPAGVSFSFAPFLPDYAPDLAIPPLLNNAGQIALWLPQRQWNEQHKQHRHLDRRVPAAWRWWFALGATPPARPAASITTLDLLRSD